jgi:integrase
MKRNIRAGVEDRWHREPRQAERDQIPYPADDSGPGSWCMDPKHGEQGSLVTTTRHGRGQRWQVRWVDDGGNERSKSFDRKVDAQRHLTGVTTAIATGTYADPRRSGVTFGAVAKTWIKAKEAASRAPKTVAGYQSLLETLILPKWEDVPLRDIDHAAMQDWITWLSTDPAARQRKGANGGLSPARVIQAHQVVRQILAYAVRVRYLAVNPASDIELPSKPQSKGIALSHDQVRALADEIANAEGALRHRSDTAPARTSPEALATMVRLLAYAGLRYGECAALRVGDVDTDRRRLMVSRSITGVRGQGRLEGGTKTHQRRSVPILTTALNDELTRLIHGRDPSEFLFPGPDGGSMSIGWFRVRFDRAAASAGLTDVTPHTLRHTAGSLALAQGASVVTVQKLLGHRNATTTMNIYSHQLPDDFDNLAAAMDAALSGSPRAKAGTQSTQT